MQQATTGTQTYERAFRVQLRGAYGQGEYLGRPQKQNDNNPKTPTTTNALDQSASPPRGATVVGKISGRFWQWHLPIQSVGLCPHEFALRSTGAHCRCRA